MFVGLDGDASELNLPKYNTWWFMRDASINKLVDDYYSHPGPVPEVPFMFVGFPSAKVLPHDATRDTLDTSSAAHVQGVIVAVFLASALVSFGLRPRLQL
jgi:hypothetical protein